MIHQAMTNPQFLALSGSNPTLTNSQGVPWTAAYVNANGDLTVDLRSDIAAESRAKIVYEYLLQFTDDPYVKDTLRFLMTREVAHFKMFASALETIQPNFPPGVLQGDPRYTHVYMNMSNGASVRGPWNQGQGAWEAGEEWSYVENPYQHVVKTKGMVEQHPIEGTNQTPEEVESMNQKLSQQRSQEIKSVTKTGSNQRSSYPQTVPTSPTGIQDTTK